MKAFTVIEIIIIGAIVMTVLAVVCSSIKDSGCKEWRTIPNTMECWNTGSYSSCEPKKECIRY